MVVDCAWILMVWVAMYVGTPTQPKGRDEYLRCDNSGVCVIHVIHVIFAVSSLILFNQTFDFPTILL